MSTPEFDAQGVVPAIHIDAERLPSVVEEIAQRLGSAGEALAHACRLAEHDDPVSLTGVRADIADIAGHLSLLGQIGWPIKPGTYDGEDLAAEMFELARRQLPRLSGDDPVRVTVEALLPALGEAIGHARLRDEQRFAREILADIARDSAECVANIATAPGQWTDPERSARHYGCALAGAKQALEQFDAEADR
jgi:hypothetical protein